LLLSYVRYCYWVMWGIVIELCEVLLLSYMRYCYWVMWGIVIAFRLLSSVSVNLPDFDFLLQNHFSHLKLNFVGMFIWWSSPKFIFCSDQSLQKREAQRVFYFNLTFIFHSVLIFFYCSLQDFLYEICQKNVHSSI